MDEQLTKYFEDSQNVMLPPPVSQKMLAQKAAERHERRILMLAALASLGGAIFQAALSLTFFQVGYIRLAAVFAITIAISLSGTALFLGLATRSTSLKSL